MRQGQVAVVPERIPLNDVYRRRGGRHVSIPVCVCVSCLLSLLSPSTGNRDVIAFVHLSHSFSSFVCLLYVVSVYIRDSRLSIP
jgi:hypothetical protein